MEQQEKNQAEEKNHISSSRKYCEFILTVLKTAFILSFLFGSMLLGFYFKSISFLPYFKISEFPFIVILVFVVGCLVLFIFGFFVFVPTYFLKTRIGFIDKEMKTNLTERLKEFKFWLVLFHLGPWLINFILFVLLVKILQWLNLNSNKMVVQICVFVCIIFSVILVNKFFVFCLKRIDRTFLKDPKEKKSIKYLFVPSLYLVISFWFLFILYYSVISSSQFGFLFLCISVGLFSFISFFSPFSERELLIFSFLFSFFVFSLLDKVNILYLTPIQLLKLGNVGVELYLKQSDEDDKSKDCKGDQKSICGTLLFRDSNFYYIEPKSCNRKEGNKAKSNNQIQQEKVVESSNQAKSDNQTNSDDQTKPNKEKIIKKVSSAEIDRVVFYKD